MYPSAKVNDFIEAYCYFPDYNMKNKDKKKNDIRRLAEAYCEDYENNGMTFEAPMMLEYVPDLDEYRPTRDAFVVAEASYEGCMCVSNNEVHMVKTHREYYSTSNKNSRAVGIRIINDQRGYGTFAGGFGYIPSTISLKSFATIYFKTGEFAVPKTNSVFVKASELSD